MAKSATPHKKAGAPSATKRGNGRVTKPTTATAARTSHAPANNTKTKYEGIPLVDLTNMAARLVERCLFNCRGDQDAIIRIMVRRHVAPHCKPGMEEESLVKKVLKAIQRNTKNYKAALQTFDIKYDKGQQYDIHGMAAELEFPLTLLTWDDCDGL